MKNNIIKPKPEPQPIFTRKKNNLYLNHQLFASLDHSPKDGNCLYSSVANGLKKFGIHIDPIELKRQAIEFGKKHAPKQGIYYLHKSDDPVTKDEYFKHHALNNTWGDQTMIQIIAECFNKSIFVINEYGALYRGSKVNNNSNDVIWLYIPSNHFENVHTLNQQHPSYPALLKDFQDRDIDSFKDVYTELEEVVTNRNGDLPDRNKELLNEAKTDEGKVFLLGNIVIYAKKDTIEDIGQLKIFGKNVAAELTPILKEFTQDKSQISKNIQKILIFTLAILASSVRTEEAGENLLLQVAATKESLALLQEAIEAKLEGYDDYIKPEKPAFEAMKEIYDIIKSENPDAGYEELSQGYENIITCLG